MRTMLAATLLCAMAAGSAIPAPGGRPFTSVGGDRAAIDQLLLTYAKAVSTKDEALFETLLLGTDIPFSDVASATAAPTPDASRNYDAFRNGVFRGPPFQQRFERVRIEQDGSLAQVSLVFVNHSANGDSWGWKTLQLLKVAGRWRIASEFYTGHPGSPGVPGRK